MTEPYCNLYVGQRVVYAPVSRMDLWLKALAEDGTTVTVPVVGEVYHVRGMYFNPIMQMTGIWLGEVTNPALPFADGVMEPNWWHADFKPVTDISSLEALLKVKPVPLEELADHVKATWDYNV